MKIYCFELKPTTVALMRTEILYSVASARANEYELVEFIYSNDGGKSESNVLKVVRELKKQGKVKVYTLARDIDGQSKEAEYLLNKYPELIKYKEKCESIIVML